MAELSLLGEMRNMHSRRKHTCLGAFSFLSVQPENYTGRLIPQGFVCYWVPSPTMYSQTLNYISRLQ